MSSHVKPCEAMSVCPGGKSSCCAHVTAAKGTSEWVPLGIEGYAGTKKDQWIMGTHGNSWEAWSRANLLHSVESASFLEDTVSNFVLPLKRLLHSQTHLQEWKLLWFVWARKTTKTRYKLIQSCLVMPIMSFRLSKWFQMSPFDLHLRWIPSKRLLVVGQHWLWQRTGGWAVIHGALEIDGTGPKFGSEMIFYR